MTGVVISAIALFKKKNNKMSKDFKRRHGLR